MGGCFLGGRVSRSRGHRSDEAREEDRFGLVPEHTGNTREGSEVGRGPASVQLGAKMLGNLDVGMDETSFIASDS